LIEEYKVDNDSHDKVSTVMNEILG